MEFAFEVLKQIYPGMWAADAEALADVLQSELRWKKQPKPAWGAYWWDADGKCGFVFRAPVNGADFLSADNTGKMNRIPFEGKRFIALAAG